MALSGAVFADGGQSGRIFCRAAGRAGFSYGSGGPAAVPPSPHPALDVSLPPALPVALFQNAYA